MSYKNKNEVTIKKDMKGMLNNPKTLLKEKIKWLRYFINEEIKRILRLNQLGFYTKGAYENLYILQTAYFKMLDRLDRTKDLLNQHFSTQINKMWLELIDQTIEEEEVEIEEEETIIQTSFQFVIKQIERVIMLDQLPFDKQIDLKLKNVSPQHLINLPEEVERVTILDEKRNPLSEHMLKINHLEGKNKSKEEKNIEYHENRKQFKLIVEIYAADDIHLIPNLEQIDGVLLRVENAYLKNNFIINIEQRLDEYRKIASLIPNKEIIIVLPTQQKLYEFLEIKGGEITNPHELSKHYYMYDMEIYCVNKIGQDHRVKVVFPKVLNDSDYMYYRTIVETGLSLYPKKKMVEIGFSVDNEVVYEYIEYYKPFDFILLDTKELYEDLYEKVETIDFQMFKKEYIHEVREVHQYARSRKKPDYIIGDFINNEDIFKKCIILGFKNFIIDIEKINNYDTIIVEYLKSRGKYKKKIKKQ